VTALLVVVATVLVAVALALRARRGRDMDLEQWSVGGRGFGSVFVFLMVWGIGGLLPVVRHHHARHA